VILYEYQCESCGSIIDVYSSINKRPEFVLCPDCPGRANQTLAVAGVDTLKESPDWVKTIPEVVEKDSGKAHCDNLIRDPTRKNLVIWLQKEGKRHIEPGEISSKPRQRTRADEERINHLCFERFQKRNAINLRG